MKIQNKFFDVLKNIKNFDAGEKFQQATIAYIVHFLYPSNEIEELKKVFKIMDKNGDGKLTYDELLKGFETVYGKGVMNHEITRIIGEMDGDSDGSISYEEFLRVSINKNKLLDERNLKLAFESFDLNKDGKLSADEIKTVLGTSQTDYVLRLIKAIDIDNNQQIDFEEFKNLMRSLLENKKETMMSVDAKPMEIENNKILKVESDKYKGNVKSIEEDPQTEV